MTRVLVLNGPNLGSLGRREPALYGRDTLADLEARLLARAAALGADLRIEQTNAEGRLVDLLEEEAGVADGVVINPGGLAHTSIVLRDAVAAFPGPVVEVHITNVHAREPFRRRALTAAAARGVVSGLGLHGYELALEGVVSIVSRHPEEATA